MISDAVSALNGSSVLKNLLIKGVDVNYGYRLVESSSDDGVVPHKVHKFSLLTLCWNL